MSKLRIGFVLTGSFCTRRVSYGCSSTHRARRIRYADSVRQRRHTRHPFWHSRALASGADRTAASPIDALIAVRLGRGAV